jgi:hypothetical protein
MHIFINWKSRFLPPDLMDHEKKENGLQELYEGTHVHQTPGTRPFKIESFEDVQW